MRNHHYAQFLKDVEEIERCIKSHKLPSFLLLAGGNSFLTKKALKSIQDSAAKEKIPCEKIKIDAISPEQFYDLWSQSSLFAEDSIYLLETSPSKKDLTKLLKPLPKRLTPQNHFLLSEAALSYSTPTKSELSRLGVMQISCTTPLAEELPRCIKDMAAGEGIQINSQGIALMIEQIGVDLDLLENEIKKLGLIFGFPRESRELTAADVRPYLGMIQEQHIFELSRHLMNLRGGGIGKALMLIEELLDRKESAQPILGIIARHIRQTLGVLGLRAQGAEYPQISAQLKLPLSVVRSYNEYGNKLTPVTLRRALHECMRVECHLKSKKHFNENNDLARIVLSLGETHAPPNASLSIQPISS